MSSIWYQNNICHQYDIRTLYVINMISEHYISSIWYQNIICQQYDIRTIYVINMISEQYMSSKWYQNNICYQDDIRTLYVTNMISDYCCSRASSLLMVELSGSQDLQIGWIIFLQPKVNNNINNNNTIICHQYYIRTHIPTY